MKHHHPKHRSELPEGGALFSKHERNRLILMTVAMVVVLGAFVTTFLKARNRDEPPQEEPVERVEVPRTEILLPDLDPAELEALVDDEGIEGRVVREAEALRWALERTRVLREVHFEAMDTVELDRERIADVLADPAAHRARPFQVHGWVDAVTSYPAFSGRPAHHALRLRVEDGGVAWAVVLETPGDGLLEDEFVRVNAIFVEVFAEEGSDGWVEGPLLVGPRAEHSYPSLGRVTSLAEGTFRFVRDDTASEITGLPWEERWELLAYARDVDPDAIDWDAAPELNLETMKSIAADGDAWRGRAVRLPPLEVLDMWNQDAGENPARMDRYSEGWLGTWEWSRGPWPLIRVQSPVLDHGLNRKGRAVGRGFFLKAHAYEPRDGGVSVAPFLVLQSVHAAPAAPADFTIRNVTVAVAGSLLLAGGIVGWMLLQDRRKSRALHEELVRRRRARRGQASHEGGAAGS